MEVIQVSPELDRRRGLFLRLIFGETKGWICIAYATRERRFVEEYFHYPDEVPKVLDLINRIYMGHNVWFCPQLFSTKKRSKEFVSSTHCAWSDLDTCQPEQLHLSPTILVESSPGRWQGYWIFDEEVDPDDAENVSQRIAYNHADDGADRSGWDISQLLRFPYTYNYKYATTPTVKIIEANKKHYKLAEFEEQYPQVQGFLYTDEPMPDLEGLPNGTELLDKQRLQISPTIWRLFQEELPKNDSNNTWSERLWKMEIGLFEAGFTAEQVFAIARDSACNKYARDGTPTVLLWKEVCRAQARYNENTKPTAVRNLKEQPLTSDEEKRQIESEDTFIERYITWAKSLGDAAPQYHQAGAFTALSSLLSGSVQLPTSFGVLKPNLWFMILADTTLTRKSTAMDIAMDLSMEVDDNILMATDGSIEGLLTSLSTRAGQPSVFLRDEFSGLLEMITKKDYYAGMPELLTKLYDGKMQKRILRKEQIDVRDPCLIVFAGGIKNKITQLLTFEHVSSGFMPRFIFITAESDIARVKPLGPPTTIIDNNKDAILQELNDIHHHYDRTTEMVIKDSNITYDVKYKWNAELTPDAWHRYNVLETQMLDAGVTSSRPDIMTPVYDRLSKSILKAAVLLSASKQRDEKIVVDEGDIVRATVYGESWRMYVQEIMENVGKGQAERQLDNVYRSVINKPGVSRSELMQAHHLSARETTQIFETLEQRGMVSRTRKGKAETLYPTMLVKPPEGAKV